MLLWPLSSQSNSFSAGRRGGSPLGGGGGEAGLTIIRMGEREGPRSNRAGKCWWERLVLKGFYGLPREGFFKGLGFGIESKSGLRLSGRRVL